MYSVAPFFFLFGAFLFWVLCALRDDAIFLQTTCRVYTFSFALLCREEEDTFLIRRGKPTTLLRFDDALEVEELKKKKKKKKKSPNRCAPSLFLLLRTSKA